MTESVLDREAAGSRRTGGLGELLRIVSFCIKATVVLFPVPTAFLTGAPPEMTLAAVYCTLVTLGLFLALGEIAGNIRRLAEAVDRQGRAS